MTSSVPNLFASIYDDPTRYACRAIPNSGSKIAIAELDKCEKIPKEYNLTVAATAADAITSTLTLAEVNGVAATANDSVTLSPGTILYVRPTAGDPAVRMLVTQEAVVTDAGATVSIDPTGTAIVGTSDFAKTWGLLRIPSWMDISLNDADSTTDTSDGETLQDSQGVVSKGITIPLRYRITDDLTAHKKVLHRYTKDIAREFFCAAKHNAYPPICGPVLGLNPNRSGANKGQAEISMTLSFQSERYFPDYVDQMEVGSAEVTLYNTVMELAGFPL